MILVAAPRRAAKPTISPPTTPLSCMSSNRKLDLDAHLEAEGVFRRFVVMAPGFAGVPAFLRGSDLLATAPSLQRFGAFQGLADAAPPIPCPTLPMYMIWSRGDHGDPAHKWLRGELEAVARTVAGRAR